MRILNNYYSGYSKFQNDYEETKYGLLNLYGYNLDNHVKKEYREDDIIKKLCHQRKK